MSGPELNDPALWPFAVYFTAVILLTAVMMGASYLIGERHRDRATGNPYECGLLPTGSARLHHSARFYLIAVFFVIFEVEAIFVFAWAINVRGAGWRGYAGMLIFIGVLLAALAYLWRGGGLAWGKTCAPRRRN
jgi:NADH-quinone oxidoreductase subunit A